MTVISDALETDLPPYSLPPGLRQIHYKLRTNLPYFAKHALKIKDKEGSVVPFIFNDAQLYLHSQLEKQRRETGRVKAIIIKGRQQGCSTYVAARYYHRATWKRGQSVFILSHESETTKKLFKIVERYYNHTPVQLRPAAKVANRREYHFADIESEYAVGTAGNENVGRGGTIQLFHGSEVGFWTKTDELQTGILQSIPDMDGTEEILESTANGMGNMLYTLTMASLNGDNDYQIIFIPWFWQKEYRRKKPHNGVLFLTDEEEEYKKNYDLDNEQMYWRRAKIGYFATQTIGSTPERKFKQEYPAYLMEAFQSSGNPLIDPERVLAARKHKTPSPHNPAPLLMGVDPARNGDRTVFAYRQGLCMPDYETHLFRSDEKAVQMQIAGLIAARIKDRQPAKVFIDVGHGWGTIDRLMELGFGPFVVPVNFGSTPADEAYLNKRAEMWCLMRDWLHGEEGPVSIPDDDSLQKDLTLVPAAKTTSSGRIQLVSKDKIREDCGISPDIGDALALTFAFPVRQHSIEGGLQGKFKKAKAKTGHILKTWNRIANRSV